MEADSIRSLADNTLTSRGGMAWGSGQWKGDPAQLTHSLISYWGGDGRMAAQEQLSRGERRVERGTVARRGIRPRGVAHSPETAFLEDGHTTRRKKADFAVLGLALRFRWCAVGVWTRSYFGRPEDILDRGRHRGGGELERISIVEWKRREGGFLRFNHQGPGNEHAHPSEQTPKAFHLASKNDHHHRLSY
jgi:hypothetical protein